MFRFLHISDVHLNKSFNTKDDQLRKQLKRFVKKTFQAAVHYAAEQKLDALVIAGDLYDHWNLSVSEIKFVLEQFNFLKEHHVKVLYASGNHDYTSFDSPLRKIEYPENVITFFDDTPKMIHIETVSGEVYKVVGCGHVLEVENRNLIKDFPIGMDLGIVHCTVESPLLNGDEGQYLPSTLETINSKGYGYFALGHVHNHGFIDKDQKICYAGVLQGLNRNEIGEKGGYLVQLSKNHVESKFVVLSSLVYEKLVYDISHLENLDQLYDFLLKSMQHSMTKKDKILTLTLTGRSKLYGLLKTKGHLEDLSQFLTEHLDLIQVIIKNELKFAYDLNEIIREENVLNELLEYFNTLKDEGLPELPFLTQNLMDANPLLDEKMKDELINLFMEDIDEDK